MDNNKDFWLIVFVFARIMEVPHVGETEKSKIQETSVLDILNLGNTLVSQV